MSAAVSALKQRARRYPLLMSLRNAVRRATPPPSGKQVIEKYLQELRHGDDLKILFGGHWSDNPGWLLLNEEQQDITRPLDFPDGVADVVFSEHVVEHVPFVSAVSFMQESFRILKPGGLCRVVCPMLDRLMTAKLDEAQGREYIRTSLVGNHQDADDVLRETLGLDGINEEPLPFLFSALYMNHGHRFIWTSSLMIKVMKQIGFSRATRYQPGEGSRADACIERRRRGIYLGHDWREELRDQHAPYDVESFVVEAIK